MQTQNAKLWPEIKGIRLFPIHEKCIGCVKVIVFEEFDGTYCRVYANPTALWHRGCPVATHVDWGNNEAQQGKKRAGQQKSRKKKAKRAGL